MTPRDFVYWLQGYLEIENPETIGEKQVQIIKDHLQLVFKKVTSNRDKNNEEEDLVLEDIDVEEETDEIDLSEFETATGRIAEPLSKTPIC